MIFDVVNLTTVLIWLSSSLGIRDFGLGDQFFILEHIEDDLVYIETRLVNKQIESEDETGSSSDEDSDYFDFEDGLIAKIEDVERHNDDEVFPLPQYRTRTPYIIELIPRVFQDAEAVENGSDDGSDGDIEDDYDAIYYDYDTCLA